MPGSGGRSPVRQGLQGRELEVEVVEEVMEAPVRTVAENGKIRALVDRLFARGMSTSMIPGFSAARVRQEVCAGRWMDLTQVCYSPCATTSPVECAAAIVG
mmetsp:Transcript_38755/g.102508  ORF Transcript_38755/g.102508 Transcript_38755/m.102508 type:complete len:101 (+) Transcript_38755:453-755(+)